MTDDLHKNSDILQASLAAIRQIIFKIIPPRDGRSPFFPDEISSPDVFRTEVTRRGIEHIPACALRMETMRYYPQNKNRQTLFHINGKPRMPDRTIPIFSLACVQVDLNVYYYDDDFKSLTEFCSRWMHKLEWTINLVNDDISVGVHLQLGDSLSIPTRNFGEAGNLYNIESGIILTTYVGTVKRVSLLKQVNINLNTLGVPSSVVEYSLTGNGPPVFSANLLNIGYFDRINKMGYISISVGKGADDWQKVNVPIIDQWEIQIDIAGDDSKKLEVVENNTIE